MNVDLHCHSIHSDGTESVQTLIEIAEKRKVEYFSITDHDTLNGSQEAIQDYSDSFSGTLIPGIEVSTNILGNATHLLAYFPTVNLDNSKLYTQLLRLQEGRYSRGKLMIDKARTNGINITLEDVMVDAGITETKGQILARPHIARALVKKGYARNFDDAFTTYLKPGKLLYVEIERVKFETWINLIHESKGLAVWAHPLFDKGQNLQTLYDVGVELTRSGIDGIEYVYGYTRREALHDNYIIKGKEILEQLINENNLLITAGGDYHGDSGTLGTQKLDVESMNLFLEKLNIK